MGLGPLGISRKFHGYPCGDSDRSIIHTHNSPHTLHRRIRSPILDRSSPSTPDDRSRQSLRSRCLDSMSHRTRWTSSRGSLQLAMATTPTAPGVTLAEVTRRHSALRPTEAYAHNPGLGTCSVMPVNARSDSRDDQATEAFADHGRSEACATHDFLTACFIHSSHSSLVHLSRLLLIDRSCPPLRLLSSIM